MSPSPRPRRARWAIGSAIILALAGWITDAPFTVNKNDATPPWCFYSAAITCGLWVIFALWVDAGGTKRFSRSFVRGGQNALLAYMMVPIFYYAMTLAKLTFYERLGDGAALIGVARSLVTATVVLWLGGFLYDRGVRLRL